MIPIGLVKDIGGKEPILHPLDKSMVVFTNGADHFICEVPTGHELFGDKAVIRKAIEGECNFYRNMLRKKHVVTMCVK